MLHLLQFDKGAFDEPSEVNYGKKQREFSNCINGCRFGE